MEGARAGAEKGRAPGRSGRRRSGGAGPRADEGAREAAGKAKEIDDAVYDLKAVNPHRKPVLDARTPEELLDLIEAKGREIAEVVAQLRGR